LERRFRSWERARSQPGARYRGGFTSHARQEEAIS
jgi:hypothetical protein